MWITICVSVQLAKPVSSCERLNMSKGRFLTFRYLSNPENDVTVDHWFSGKPCLPLFFLNYTTYEVQTSESSKRNLST